MDALREWNVPRSSVPFDLRELVGAGRDPRQAAYDSAQALRSCPFLPSGLTVHLAHYDDVGGKLSVSNQAQNETVRPPSPHLQMEGKPRVSSKKGAKSAG